MTLVGWTTEARSVFSPTPLTSSTLHDLRFSKEKKKFIPIFGVGVAIFEYLKLKSILGHLDQISSFNLFLIILFPTRNRKKVILRCICLFEECSLGHFDQISSFNLFLIIFFPTRNRKKVILRCICLFEECNNIFEVSSSYYDSFLSFLFVFFVLC
eukprot:TRINITY_DN24763_c0_g1_i1.p1 TRINITY_DN24763_c0_g1~~TRINITY_DN24763_c0_g1_i1.p1  ORF type:complete len:156 (-),score=9.32 TRINITY_DN24763_c0_g1_i1:683-1150(-)